MNRVLNQIIEKDRLESEPKIIVKKRSNVSIDNYSYSDFLDGASCSVGQVVSVILNNCNNDYFFNNKIVIMSSELDKNQLVEKINETWSNSIYELLKNNQIELEIITGKIL